MSADNTLPSQYLGADDAYATRRLQIAPPINEPTDAPLYEPSRKAGPQRPNRFPIGSWLLNMLVVAIVAALIAIPAGLYYLDRSYSGKIYPNIRVAGITVGEMTPEQAEDAITARHAAFLAQPATLRFEDRTWQPTAEELGLGFDVQAAVDQAFRAGRGQGFLADLLAVNAIWQQGVDIPLKASVNQQAVQQYVQRVANQINQPPIDAELALEGTTVRTTPMQIGRQVQIDETTREVTDALGQFAPATLTVRTRELVPRLTDTAVANAQAQIAARLDETLAVTVNQRTYEWTPAELALMLDIARVAENQASDRIAVGFNELQIDRRLRKITDETGRGSVNPRVAWNNGKLEIIKPGETGLRLNATGAQQALMAWTGSENAVALPVDVVQPQVTEANLQSLGIKELVSVGRSDYSGSAEYRIQNIGVGMQKFNGLLLAPGEEFSFNENVGSIDAANGFVEGYAIIQNRTQLEFGGGICQDSTTFFRAAFWAGLPITERWGHSFYISWYDKYAFGPEGNGPGMDATIFTSVNGPDLKFVNDTGNWLLIESMSNNATSVAEVRMYGTKLNREVGLRQEVIERTPAIETPQFIADPDQPRGTYKRTDTKRGGMTINVYRTITIDGQNQKPRLFQTVFKPWADKYAINPADLNSKGRPTISGPWSPRQQAPAPVAPVEQAPAAPVAPVEQAPVAPADPNAQPAPAAQG